MNKDDNDLVDFYIRLWRAPFEKAAQTWRLLYRGRPDGAGELETTFMEAGLDCDMRTVKAGEPPAGGEVAATCPEPPSLAIWKRWQQQNPSFRPLVYCGKPQR